MAFVDAALKVICFSSLVMQCTFGNVIALNRIQRFDLNYLREKHSFLQRIKKYWVENGRSGNIHP